MVESRRIKATMAAVLISFWFFWTLLVSASDLVTVVRALGYTTFLPQFDSHNMDMVRAYWAHYHVTDLSVLVSTQIFFLLLVIVDVWFFFQALLATLRGSSNRMAFAERAFFWLVGIHLLFVLGGELFIQYGVESSHLERMGIVILTCWLYQFCSRDG